jgi:hypothetical protein
MVYRGGGPEVYTTLRSYKTLPMHQGFSYNFYSLTEGSGVGSVRYLWLTDSDGPKTSGTATLTKGASRIRIRNRSYRYLNTEGRWRAGLRIPHFLSGVHLLQQAKSWSFIKNHNNQMRRLYPKINTGTVRYSSRIPEIWLLVPVGCNNIR